MQDSAPRQTEKAQKAQAEKQKRLAEALRANLHRRKSQARARAEDAVQDGAAAESGDSSGE
ncbi:MAG TPA: hypothetical protein VM661_02240 [Candidatus Sulfotelmatobacter sp.]|jgi:hypothetical protein|nr:hypothetical protein [Candidatus Sulfotelmatobacter sp.]